MKWKHEHNKKLHWNFFSPLYEKANLCVFQSLLKVLHSYPYYQHQHHHYHHQWIFLPIQNELWQKRNMRENQHEKKSSLAIEKSHV